MQDAVAPCTDVAKSGGRLGLFLPLCAVAGGRDRDEESHQDEYFHWTVHRLLRAPRALAANLADFASKLRSNLEQMVT
jgi:hypothetical protein